MPYQTAWLEKIKSLPDDILARLPNPIEGRCFLLGPGADLFKPVLEPVCKPFVGTEVQLSAFPKGTFDLIISLWSLSPSEPLRTLNLIRAALKEDGQFAVLTYIENTPEEPLKILKKIIANAKELKNPSVNLRINSRTKELKMYKSALPESAGHLRKMLGKCWFKDVRVFKDKIICHYQSPEDLYKDMESALFSPTEPQRSPDLSVGAVPGGLKAQIRAGFVKEAGKLLSDTKGVIEHHFVGATGLK